MAAACRIVSRKTRTQGMSINDKDSSGSSRFNNGNPGKGNYAPFVTRSPFLLIVCLLVILCLMLYQIALNKSVAIDDRQTIPPSAKVRRQAQIEHVTIRPIEPRVESCYSSVANTIPRDLNFRAVGPRQTINKRTSSRSRADLWASSNSYQVDVNESLAVSTRTYSYLSSDSYIVTEIDSLIDVSTTFLSFLDPVSKNTAVMTDRSQVARSVNSLSPVVFTPDTISVSSLSFKPHITTTTDWTTPPITTSAAYLDPINEPLVTITIPIASPQASPEAPMPTPSYSRPENRPFTTTTTATTTGPPDAGGEPTSYLDLVHGATIVTVSALESNSMIPVFPSERSTMDIATSNREDSTRPIDTNTLHSLSYLESSYSLQSLTASSTGDIAPASSVTSKNFRQPAVSDTGGLPPAATQVNTQSTLNAFTGLDHDDGATTKVAADSVDLGATVTTITSATSGSMIVSREVYTAFIYTTTESDGLISSVTVIISPPTQTPGQGVNLASALHGSVRQLAIEFEKPHYIYATYSATLFTILIKNIWAAVHGGNVMMEPFYQLHESQGASAQQSLMSNYLSGISWQSLRAILGGHWIMILTLVTTILVSVLPPLAAESMGVRPLSVCTYPDGHASPCNPAWILNVTTIRILQSIFCITTVCVVIIIGVGIRRRSGINANPSSIATMASLLHHPRILAEIRAFRDTHSRKEMTSILAKSRYQISSYQDHEGHEHLGLVNTCIGPKLRLPVSSHAQLRQDSDHTSSHVDNRPLSPSADRQHTHGYISISLEVILVLFSIGVLIVVIKYRFEFGNTPFNLFFNSQKFGPRFILTSASSIVAVIWLKLEHEVRVYTLYRTLSCRHASASHTILLTVDGTPHQNLFRSLVRRNYLHFSVALASVLGDLLIVAVAGVPFSRAQLFSWFVASTWVTVAILAYQLLVMGAVLLWRRSCRKLGIPRDVNATLLSVWMSLANEGNAIRAMLEDGWSQAGRKERDEHVVSQGATFFAGWVTECDGRRRWCVDADADTDADVSTVVVPALHGREPSLSLQG